MYLYLMTYNRGTEIKLESFKDLNVTFGSIDKHNPKTIYLRISGWCNTINYYNDNNYKTIIRKFHKEIRTSLFKELNNKFNKSMTMVDLDIRESGITNGKSSFMGCEITLHQINKLPLDSDEIYLEINRVLRNLIEDVFKRNKHFEFFKKKKTANESLTKA